MEALRANQLRTVLTMLGVVIGSACIVLVVTVALSGKRYIISQIEAVGANIVYAEVIRSGGTTLPDSSDEISLADMEAVSSGVPHVIRVAGTRDIMQNLISGGSVHPVRIVGVTQDFQQIRKLIIVRGRYFDRDDMYSHSKVCLLMQPLAARVYPSEDPVGQQIQVGELTFTVIGVFRERVATFDQSEITSDTMLVPFSLIRYYTGEEFIQTFYAQADHPDNVEAVTRQVHEMLESLHRSGINYRVTNLKFDSRGSEEYLARYDDSSDSHRDDRPRDQRDRHYEHHARNRDRADA